MNMQLFSTTISNKEKIVLLTLAVGSLDLMARNAEKDAVPPPINKYGIFFGMSFESEGILITLPTSNDAKLRSKS